MRTLIISLVLFAIVIYLAQGESIRFGQVNVNTEEGNLLDHLMDVNRVMHRRIREDLDIDRPLQFLVNMKGNVRAHQVEDLLGKKLAHFIPPKSFVVYASPLSIAKALSSSKVKAKDLINWIGYVKPAFKSPLKIDPESLLNKNGVDLIVILTSDSSTTAAILHHLLLNRFKQGVNIHYTSDGLLRVHADVHIAGKVLDWLKEREEVHWIERSRTMKLFNNAANIIVQGNGNFTLDPVGKPLWDRNLTGEGEIVAVTDSGLDYDNCFFYDPGQTVELNTVNFNHRKVVGYFTAREGTEFGDGRDSVNGHGTHVCGSVAGSMYSGAPNTEELEKFAGVAKGAKLFFQDASVPENPSSISYGDIYALFEQSYTVGNARIHSNSFGCGAFKCEFDCVCYVEDEEGNDIVIPNSNCTEAYGTDCCKVCNDYTVDSARADKFLYEHNDMIILFSAGNNGEYTYNGTVGSPGLAKNVLTVGASKTTNSNFLVSTNYQDPAMFGVSSQLACCLERIFPCCPALAEQVYSDTNVYNHSNLASFSSRGPTSDQRNKPDLVAPGQWVVSMHSDGRLNTNQCGTQRPEGANNAALIAMQGTSMSCPVTAGAAAIVRQYYRDTGRYSNPSGPLLKATLINSATPLPGTVSIDGSRTLTVDLPKETPNLYEGYGLVSLSNVLQFEDSEFQLYTFDMINITEGESHTYLFASNSTTGTSQLKVTLAWYDLPSSVVSKGFLVNDLDLTVGYFNGTDVTALGNGIEDHLNNVEQVVLVDIEPGSPLNITVTGFKLQTEQQSYALVITGKDITDQIAEASTS